LNFDEDIAPPAEIQLAPVWVLKLNASDAMLVLKALGGRLNPSKRDGTNEIDQARALGDRLTAMRAHCGRAFTSTLQRAEQAMEAAR
jgi:hypothetical protein